MPNELTDAKVERIDVHVAVIQPVCGGIGDLNIRLFRSLVSAQQWIDESQANAEADGKEILWDIYTHSIEN